MSYISTSCSKTVAFTDNVVIKFIVEKDAEDSNKKLKTSVMKGPSIVEELNKKLKVGQDILKVRVNSECVGV